MQTNCHLTYEQKIILKKLNQWLNEKRIPTNVRINAIKNSVWVAFKSSVEDRITAFLEYTLDATTIDTFVECGFFEKLENQEYSISKLHIQKALEDNSRDSIRANSSHRLNQEQWDFLEVLRSAIYGKYLTQKSETGFYIRPILQEKEDRITAFDGFAAIIADGRSKELAILLRDFLQLENFGYLKKARNGHYYIITNKVLPVLEDYLSQESALESNFSKAPANSRKLDWDIFMVMPFRDALNGVYESIIIPLSQELSLSIKRGDEGLSASDSIIEEVFSYIKNAKIIIVDCTETDGKPNGNVYYELGYADALDKNNVILISQTTAVDLPFDIRHRRVIHYTDNARGNTKLKEELKKAIQSILGN